MECASSPPYTWNKPEPHGLAPPVNPLPATPAFIYDEHLITHLGQLLAHARERSGCRMLYSIKALPFLPVLELLAPWVDGFSVSSLFEARLASRVEGGSRHITSPGLRTDEIAEIGQLCDFAAFNSLGQFQRLQPLLPSNTRAGLRINPQHSFLPDSRFDPCRPHSKLGVPMRQLAISYSEDDLLRQRLAGLHLHTLFSSRSFEPLRETVCLLEEHLTEVLPTLDWLNLGGGYLFEYEEDLDMLCGIVERLQQRFGLTVYFEPGKGLVGQAGYLVASVIDLFESDGKTIAILDSTVNHDPEIFEYQTRPEPAWREPEQGVSAILAGCTCLAGDLFGEYRFEHPLNLGDRVAFRNVGAYSLIKANRFNGHNLPSIYAWDGATTLRPMKHYRYEDYLEQWRQA